MKNIQVIPRINVNDKTIQVTKIFVKDGPFTVGEDLIMIETSKTTIKIKSQWEGYANFQCRVGDILEVGSSFVSFTEEKETALNYVKDIELSTNQGKARFSSMCKMFISENNIDTSLLSGAWTKKNLEIHLGLKKESVKNKMNMNNNFNLAKADSVYLRDELFCELKNEIILKKEKILKSKKIEIENLYYGQSGLVNSSLTVEFDSAPVWESLKKNGSLARTVLPYIVYELAKLLVEFPKLNSFFYQDEIVYYNVVNIGQAIELDRGLKVMTIKQADKLLPFEIHERMTENALKYLSDSIDISDLEDSTFTITDLFSQNIRYFQPLINKQQAAILGIGGDYLAAGKPMSLTLTFDHRILSGLEVAQFLNKLKNNIIKYSCLD